MVDLFEPYLGQFFEFFSRLEAIGEVTNVVHLPELDAKLDPIAASMGMQLPVIKYTILCFLAFPMAAVLKALPNKNLKHMYSLLTGLFMLQWVYGPDWIHAGVSSTVTYLLCLVVPGRYMASTVFLFVMSYMTVSHAYRMYVSYLSGIFDFTGTQMVLTMKLTSFAYNLYDGTTDKANVFRVYDDKRLARLYGERKRFAIEKLPNPLEYFGYIFCFTCILAGPAFEFKDYVTIIDKTAFQKPIRKDKTKDDVEVEVPSTLAPSLYRLFVAVLCLLSHMQLSARFPHSVVYNAEWISLHSWYFRWGYTSLSLFAERLKYYFVWKVAEGACVMAGFGFEGYDQKSGEIIGWGGVENIDIVGFELATSIQPLSRAWNKRTQGWLERYTYGRTGNSLLATYFVSALWHGLYPGFFLFFMTIPILTSIERLVRVKINPLVIPGYDGRDISTAPKGVITRIYWILSIVITSLSANYCVQVFPIYSWERSMAAWGSYNHIPHFLFVLIYIFLSVAPTPRTTKKEE